ncbi:MAG: DUF1385 domain-containing protein [Anaerolineae bacterium]|nr:DUF1385 domain-containing protein [Anaerolineae bacterium]MDW8070123.1 DUF1385 domain-containing protein [Anaerolineae bacterium]
MAKPFNYGGQAILEGVMMRGSRKMCLAVRSPKGAIITHCEDLNPRIYGGAIARIPFLRGLVMLWDALGLGMRALMFSADVALGEEEVKFSGPMAWGTLAISLTAAVAIFFVGPLLLISLLEHWITSEILSNLVEGIVRLGFFLLYVWGVGFVPDIQRVFAYHGAEHKTINAYEAGDALTVEAVARRPTAHTRCGTAFLLQVVVISILLFTLLGRPSMELRIASRILLIPVIAGVAYELLRFTAAYRDHPLVRAISAPGLWLQGLTTRQPDEGMLEVAITALRKLLAEEGLVSGLEASPAAQPTPPLSVVAPMER